MEVTERDGYRLMRFTHSNRWIQGQQSLSDPWDYPLEYLQQHLVASCIAKDVQHILILGLGVGALPRLLEKSYPSASIMVVERNPGVIKAARQHFGLQLSPRLKVLEGDAVEVLRIGLDRTFDLIFDDIFDGIEELSPLTQREYTQSLLAHLNAGGVFIRNDANGAANPLEDDSYNQFLFRAPSKRNITMVLTKAPLHWDKLKNRAAQYDRLGLGRMRLVSEVMRLKETFERDGQS